MPLRALLIRIDSVPERALLWVNTGLACFVALAHGSALALTYSNPTPEADEIRQLAAISLPMAAAVIVTAFTALIRPNLRRSMLAVHGFVLVASAIYLLLWAVHILIEGTPKGNFSWSVGFPTVWVCYSFFVLSRFSLPSRVRVWPAVYYAPLLALAVAAPIDVGVFVQMLGDMRRHLG